MFVQIAGKIRLALAPPEPQWAHVALYVTSRGLTTSPIPYRDVTFQVDFDFVVHALKVSVSDGRARSFPLLPPRSVKAFYLELTGCLRELELDVQISDMPQEVSRPIAFSEDTTHAAYDPEQVNRFWHTLVQADTAFKFHRAPFSGRHTPVQFFWGSFDLAYVRYSGRPAQPPSKANLIVRKSMDAEEISAGYWPGDERLAEPAYFCYAHPAPPRIESAELAPSQAYWDGGMGLFLLRYADVRESASPRDSVLQFLRSTYEACATLGGWEAARQ
jgi:hypothetical protein